MRGLLKKTITRSRLERDLRAAGVQPGDVLVVHSALSKVGWVSGGPKEAVRALQSVLGPQGTLVMPTFSFNLTGWNLPPFDPLHTPSRVGLLTDTFWRMERVLRTPHPTHSVPAWGRFAREITQGVIDYEPLGIGSPFDRVRLAGGKVLLVGVGHTRNSTIHLAESLAAAPYLAVPFSTDTDHDEASYIVPGCSEPVPIWISEMPGSSEGFEVLETPLARMGVTRDVPIGSAAAQIMDANELCHAVETMVRQNPLFLLGGENPSEITRRRRAHVEDYLRREAARVPALSRSSP